MLKKMVFVMLVALMVAPAFGWDRVLPPIDVNNIRSDQTVDWEKDGNHRQRKAETWNWPATYDEVPICDMKVQMDVGFWIKLTDCSNQVIKVKQTFINEYYGEAKCKAWTNVATKWSASFAKFDNVDLGGYNKEAKVTPSSFAAAPKGQELVISLKLWDVSLANIVPNQSSRCTDIGTVTIKVRPDVKPNYFMNACDSSQKYPVYAPTN